MKYAEAERVNEKQLVDLRKWVARGEGLQLEFKRKAAHPEKIVRELIAFANTDGGTLLIGVDDNGSIPGVAYPDEELLAVNEALDKYCRPRIAIVASIIPISVKKFVVCIQVTVSSKRPHYFKIDAVTRESYVRSKDMSVKASREMLEIVRRAKTQKDIRFTFGDAEKILMEHLAQQNVISLQEFRSVAKLNRFLASKKLILLVLANVLRIIPSEKGDVYSRIG